MEAVEAEGEVADLTVTVVVVVEEEEDLSHTSKFYP
jgi:hypothetical protein